MAPNEIAMFALAIAASRVLSGLLAEQEARVRAAYPGVRFAPAALDEGWIRLDGTVGGMGGAP